METRNLDRAMDIISKLIVGEPVSEKGANSSLFQEYSTNGEVYDIVHMMLKKMNLSIYEYNNSIFVSAGDNNKTFGYTNEELKKEIGVKLNRELFLCYFIIYNVIQEFYSDSSTSTFTEFVKIENIVRAIDSTVSGIVDRQAGIVLNEVEENSFKQIALSWDELPAVSMEEQSGMRAARNSKSGFVKMVFNFMTSQELLVEAQNRYYPTDRLRALAENYFQENKGRFSELMGTKEV